MGEQRELCCSQSSGQFGLAKRRQVKPDVDGWSQLDDLSHWVGLGVGTTYGGDNRGGHLHHKPTLQRRASSTATSTGGTSRAGRAVSVES
ncbi:hypothetical protein V6N13_094351 [Hibiscus sabdariffa]|uniref:Uncharacterized protein n=1 Tax=Hibiscus sabdariffa TaxID=183260 RepID=A0ABR2PQF4_9ROSI